MIAAIILGLVLRELVLTCHESRPGKSWPLMPDARANRHPTHRAGSAHERTTMNGVDDPPANPTSLGNVWIGETRPRPDYAKIDHDRLVAMERRLLEWADQLEANRDKPGDVGKFIAMELRNRMAGTPAEPPLSASDHDAHGVRYLEPFDRGRR